MTFPAEAKRVGGELVLTPDDFLPRYSQPYSFARTHELWLDLGRSALRVGLRALQAAGARPRLWLPDYVCASLVEGAAHESFDVRFYPDSPAPASFGAPDAEAGDVFLYIHYFGKRNEAVESWLSNVPSRSWFVIEDCVQAVFTGGLGKTGDLVITSLRKWLPQPDGALLSSDLPLPLNEIAQPSEKAINQKLIGKLLRAQRIGDDRKYLDLLAAAEASFASGKPALRSYLSEYLQQAADIPALLQRRCGNWIWLASWFAAYNGKSQAIRPLFKRLDAQEVPLGFPVVTGPGDRDTLREYLAREGIFCPVHWRLEEALGRRPPEAAARLSRSMLTLPVDQHCDEGDMSRMADAIERFYRTAGS